MYLILVVWWRRSVWPLNNGWSAIKAEKKHTRLKKLQENKRQSHRIALTFNSLFDSSKQAILKRLRAIEYQRRLKKQAILIQAKRFFAFDSLL